MSRAVPQRIYEFLISGFVDAQAHWLLGSDQVKRYTPGKSLHPGDAFGRVIAWQWLATPTEVGPTFGSYLAQLHKWDDLADDRIRMDDLLNGLAFAVPNDFPRDEFRALRAAIERDAPEAYGANPNP